jgi:signal transduction histidine kinase
LLSLASVLDLVAQHWWRPLWIIAGFAGLAAMVVAGTLAISLLRSALDHRDLSMLSLSLRVETAEDTVRREQERLHELRATMAGLRSASARLSDGDETLDARRKRRLEQMMTAELVRLERLLSQADRTAPATPVALDELLRPLVVSHREQGLTVHWRPSGLRALARADEFAQIINILMCNCARHATGSPVHMHVEDADGCVRVVVRDEGPGVPADMAEHLFDRGARAADSPGHGLGLAIARRLARAQDGDLALLAPRRGEGAAFALTVPGVPTSPSGPAPTTRLQETT